MHVISSFQHSAFLELAINQLQQYGIQKESIAAVPLEIIAEQPKLFDTLHRADGYSLIDLAAVLGTVFSVLGATFGFEFKWGPVIWGLLGLAFGALAGFVLDYFLTTKRIHAFKNQHTTPSEVVLIVKCEEKQYQAIKNILTEHRAIAVGKLMA
jgi:hypothetical protein